MRRKRKKYKPPEIKETPLKMINFNTTNVLQGCVICLSGKLSRPQEETIDFIRKNGGIYTKHVSNKVLKFLFYFYHPS